MNEIILAKVSGFAILLSPENNISVQTPNGVICGVSSEEPGVVVYNPPRHFPPEVRAAVQGYVRRIADLEDLGERCPDDETAIYDFTLDESGDAIRVHVTGDDGGDDPAELTAIVPQIATV